jgi:hypothetical protein
MNCPGVTLLRFTILLFYQGDLMHERGSRHGCHTGWQQTQR